MLSTPKFFEDIKIVPLVPSEMLQAPSPTVPVPTAAAALSPAPATILQFSEIPSLKIVRMNTIYRAFQKITLMIKKSNPIKLPKKKAKRENAGARFMLMLTA